MEGLFKEGIFWNIVELCGHKLERLILMGHVLGGYVSLIIKSSNFWSFLKIIFFLNAINLLVLNFCSSRQNFDC